MQKTDFVRRMEDGAFDDALKRIYGDDETVVAFQRQRYVRCIDDFYKEFGEGGDLRLFSVPGRSEIGGNHTDHNHGRVLACAVDLDIIAVARKTDDGLIRVKSEGFDMDEVVLSDLAPRPEERGHSQALLRGVAARLKDLGYRTGGFEACTTSRVLKGSGLSSSAAFEVMLANILSHFYNGGSIEPVVLAQVSQFAESGYFGKPCGLMDQTACAVGGFVAIDFADPARPVIEKTAFDFSKTGTALCIVDTAGDHSDLTEDYADIQNEMKQVAFLLGGKVLRECDEAAFYAKLPEIRKAAGDRAALRAIHFFGDNARVLKQTEALRNNDFAAFRKLVIESGRSSFMYLQNVYSVRKPAQQGIPLALALAERLLAGTGAWRVHGGGFAGTIQAFVPLDLLERFVSTMNAAFGGHACYVLSVRNAGAVEVL